MLGEHLRSTLIIHRILTSTYSLFQPREERLLQEEQLP